MPRRAAGALVVWPPTSKWSGAPLALTLYEGGMAGGTPDTPASTRRCHSVGGWEPRRPGNLRSRGASCQGSLSGISPIWHGDEPADDAPENQPAVPIPDGLDSPQVVAWAMAPRPWWLAMSTDAHARALRIVPSPG